VVAGSRQLKRPCAVVPVLLPGARSVHLPVFVEGLTWVDLTVTEPDSIDQAHVGHCPQASNRMFWKWSLSTDIRMSAPLAK
jgi:hypothetical protein